MRDALATELKVARMLNDKAHVRLSGSLDKTEMSSTTSTWQLAATIHSSNGKSLQVSETYKFSGSMIFSAEEACLKAGNAFVFAVQNLIFRAVTAPDFRALLE